MRGWWRFWQHPVLGKEFRERMRKRGTFWGLTIYLTVIGLIMLMYFYLVSASSSIAFGVSEQLFVGLFIIQLVTMALIVPGVTAGVISGERERQTLSILLTTPLSSTGIVIGKWVSSLSYILLLIFASLPLYAIIFLYGGLSPLQLIEGFVHLFVTIFFLGSLGILFSVLFKRTVVSTVITYLTVAAVGIGTGILFIFWESFRNVNSNIDLPVISDLLMGLNPITALLTVLIGADMLDHTPFFHPYYFYVIFYTLSTLLALILSIYFLSPMRWKRWSWKKVRTGE